MSEIERKKLHQINNAFKVQDYFLANSLLIELCKISPNKYEYQLNLAVTYRKINKPQLAYETYLLAKKINDKDPILYFNIANLLFEDLYKAQESIENFLESLRLNPDNIECWINLSNVYIKIERFDLAQKTSEKVLLMDNMSFDGNAIQGFCLLSLGRPGDAKPFIEKALDIKYDRNALKCLSVINHFLGKINDGIVNGIESDGAFLFYSDDRPYKLI
tara:strand:- start:921 stop:1574 length:654 start_codon:yes stop_codon:yes gene_type:complete